MVITTQNGKIFENDELKKYAPMYLQITDDNEILLCSSSCEVFALLGKYENFEEAHYFLQSFFAYKDLLRPHFIFPPCGQLKKNWERRREVVDWLLCTGKSLKPSKCSRRCLN